MITVKKPVLLDEHLRETEILYPSKGSLKMEMNGVPEASLTLGSSSNRIPMHAWVRIYNQLGLVGIFRRTSGNNTAGSDKVCTLRHGIDILQDSVWEAETDFEGTKEQFIVALLNQQTGLIQGPGDSAPRKPWVLGSCADTSSYSKKISYDNLLDLLTGLVEDGDNYYLTYDQTGWPWTVSLTQKQNDVRSEFRLSRNIDKCRIKDNDSEMCTRLVLNINGMVKDTGLSDLSGDGTDVSQNRSIFRIYNNTAAQANYGIIVKHVDIDVTRDTLPGGPFPESDAFAADYLARRADPQLQIQIDGYVLKGITGEDWDESRIGTVSRVKLAEYPAPIDERVVSVSYPDLYGIPDKVTVSMANALPTLTRSVASTQKSVTEQAKSGRGSAREAENFKQHFTITDKAGNVLKQAGMHLDGNGLLVYADDAANMVGAKFKVQSDKVSMVVGTNENGNFIKAGKICLSINNSGDSQAVINASKIYLLGQTIADTITTSFIESRLSTSTSLSCVNLTVTGEAYVRNIAGQSANVRSALTGVQIIPDGDGYKLQYSCFNAGWTDAGSFSRAVDLDWSYGAGHSGSSDPGSAAKQYSFLDTEDWAWFNVTVNGESKKIKIHILH